MKRIKNLNKIQKYIIIGALIFLLIGIFLKLNIIGNIIYLYYNYNAENRCWDKNKIYDYNIWSYNNVKIARSDNDMVSANKTYTFYRNVINSFESMTNITVEVDNLTIYYLKNAKLCCGGYPECLAGNGTRLYSASDFGDPHEIIHVILNNRLTLPNENGLGFEEAFVTRLSVLMDYFENNESSLNSEHMFLNNTNMDWEEECDFTLKNIKDYDRSHLCKYDSLIRRLEVTYTDGSKREILEFWIDFLRKVYERGGVYTNEELFDFIEVNYENGRENLKKWEYIA